ncbi:MAG: AAA family ATPase [Prevotella sp.]|nr:AAA family ATPase [Prevotella sp.]
MEPYEITQFQAVYDCRSDHWQYAFDDIIFAWQPAAELKIILKGVLTIHRDTPIPMTLYIYDDHNNEGDTEGLRLLDSRSIDDLVPYEDGGFDAVIHTNRPFPKPHTDGEFHFYTLQVELDDTTLSSPYVIVIANMPKDMTKLIRPTLVNTRYVNFYPNTDQTAPQVQLELETEAGCTMKSVVAAYLAFLPDGELLGDAPDQMVTGLTELADFSEQNTVTLTFNFPLIDDWMQTRGNYTLWLYVTHGAKTILRVPYFVASHRLTGSTLSEYIVHELDKLLPAPHFHYATQQPLAPPAIIELLDFLDKRSAFDAIRHENSGIWKRRHLVFTGKKGTGKRTAARAVYEKLAEREIVADIAEYDAIELLDPVNGYSPKIEDTLDQNEHNLVVINNAEELALKGTVGVLNGMEILASKLRKMDNIVVVLTGRTSQMQELITMCEPARELFYTFYEFPDVPPEQMMTLTRQRLSERNFLLTPEADGALKQYFEYAYNLRGNNFGNMYFAWQTLDDEVLPRLIRRTISDEMTQKDDVGLILPEDIPQIEERDPSKPLAKLEELIGLDNVKESIINHTSLVRLNKIRADRGLYNRMPPMHMVFTGNPGTGKTTIAKYLGEIYRGIGALSSGHLVETDRSKLVGQYIGETEKNTLNAIQRASGGVLFIDEAYNLFVESQDNRDFGMRVIETLLTYLSMEDTDMIVILAGYTNEMRRLLESNPGLKSRFPYIFHFEDYSPEQLLNIGKLVLRREQYRLTPEAEQALSRYIIEEYNQKDEHFGNGRFITRLLTSHIIPSLSQRLSRLGSTELSDELLSTITPEDIPQHDGTAKLQPVDETILSETLAKLDQLVGLDNAKKALHDYVTVVREERRQNAVNPSSNNLYWNFIGQTGTGKSTVAELLGKLLQGLGMLRRGHTVILNIEELGVGDTYQTLEKALKRAADGLLFMDMDSPRYKDQPHDNIRMWIVNKINESKQQTAVVFAEASDGNENIAKDLALNGIASLYHSIIFNDYTVEQLTQLLASMLLSDYRLRLTPDAEKEMSRYIGSIHSAASRNNPVNARTIQLLAQTVAQVARLRIADSGAETAEEVLLQDVNHFEGTRHTGRIGF